jgi:hypothetical protein
VVPGQVGENQGLAGWCFDLRRFQFQTTRVLRRRYGGSNDAARLAACQLVVVDKVDRSVLGHTLG